MPGYSYIQYGAIKTQLLERLQDPSAVYYQNGLVWSEIGLALNEALRTWNCLTGGYWRNRQQFTLNPGQSFYDLPTVLPSLLAYNVKDQELIAELEFSLIEPLNVTAWSGTEQFIFDDLVRALERRRNQFLVETGLVITHLPALNVQPTPIGRVDLTVAPGSDSIIDIRRAAWMAFVQGGNTVSNITPMFPMDEWAGDAFTPDWNITAATPLAYSVVATPVLQLQILPIPVDKGQLDLLTVNAGATLNPAVGVLLGIPDDWTWIIKYGALADLLLKDGPARDADRASYCTTRWNQGIELARSATSVLKAYIDEVQAPIMSIADMDAFNPGWQFTTGAPNGFAMAGFNLIAVANVPDTNNPYSATLDVVQNAPVPASAGADTTLIQIGREELDAILGYAQHVLSFKMGGADFIDTQDLFNNFVMAAAVYNDRLEGMSVYRDVMTDSAHRETEQRSRRQSDIGPPPLPPPTPIKVVQ